ncbi:MAG: LemA family protein, partial [Clostridiales bacterium]|jgi:hypothetical protein|nr:LemA family protein [Clostridiales bacterium]
MFSFFGIISFIVFFASIAAMILYNKVMKHRIAVDECLFSLDESLQTGLETEEAEKALNESIKKYNSYISAFPANLMAGILGLEQEN